MTLRVKVGSAESEHFIDLDEGQEMLVNISQDNITRTLQPLQKLRGAKLVAGKPNKGGKIVYIYSNSGQNSLQVGASINPSSIIENTEEPIINGQSMQIDGNLVATGTD